MATALVVEEASEGGRFDFWSRECGLGSAGKDGVADR
jgi:hypothetical protein